jgi:N-acetyltransferase
MDGLFNSPGMNIDLSKLSGKYLYLSFLSPDDREFIRPLAKDGRIWEFNKMLPVDDSFNDRFDMYFDRALDPDLFNGQHTFLIRKTSDDAIIGMTRLYEVSASDQSATIGYTWYIPSVWGKVYNKECKLLLLQYIFEELKFNRAEFRVAHENLRSQKAVEKIGGVKEGILRKHGFRPDGSVRHTVIYSIIDDEWPDKKENLQRLIEACEID